MTRATCSSFNYRTGEFGYRTPVSRPVQAGPLARAAQPRIERPAPRLALHPAA